MNRNPDDHVPSGELAQRLGEGGFSHSERKQTDAPDTGSFASIWGHETVVPGGAGKAHIDDYRVRNAGVLSRRGNFLGGWREESGDALDVSRQFPAREEALEFGRKNAQKAIYDADSPDDPYVDVSYGEQNLPLNSRQFWKEGYREAGRQAVDAQLHGRAAEGRLYEAGTPDEQVMASRQIRSAGEEIASKVFAQQHMQTGAENDAAYEATKPATGFGRAMERLRGPR